MQSLLRWLQLLAMVVWVGGLCFFAFVLAPTAFRVLPSIHLAGLIVGQTLRVFDVVGLACGGLFLASTALMFQRAVMRVRGRYEMEFLLAAIMVAATAYIHWNILPSMDADQAHAGGDIASMPETNAARIHFDKLHHRSENVEGAVLFMGLGVVFLMSREHAPISAS